MTDIYLHFGCAHYVTKVKRGEQLLIADISFAVLCLFGVVC